MRKHFKKKNIFYYQLVREGMVALYERKVIFYDATDEGKLEEAGFQVIEISLEEVKNPNQLSEEKVYEEKGNITQTFLTHHEAMVNFLSRIKEKRDEKTSN